MSLLESLKLALQLIGYLMSFIAFCVIYECFRTSEYGYLTFGCILFTIGAILSYKMIPKDDKK